MTHKSIDKLFIEFLKQEDVQHIIEGQIRTIEELDLPGMELAIRFVYGPEEVPVRLAVRVGDIDEKDTTYVSKTAL